MSQEHFLSIARRLLELDGEASDGLSEARDYFFTGAQRQHQLETIRHLASFGDLLLMLEAEPGSGKTALLNKVASELKAELQVIFVRVTDESTPVTLVQDIANKSSIFATPSEDLQSLLARCKASYQSLYAQKSKRTLLIIDDVHRAQPGLIKSIVSGLELPQTDAPLVVLMSSSKPMSTFLDGYRPEDVHMLSLNKLKRAELQDYIRSGLASVGYFKDVELDNARLDALYVRSGGLPKNIETYMGSAIFGGEEAGSAVEPVTTLPARVPVAALATIVVVLLTSFLFVAQQHDLFSGLIDVEPEGDEMMAQRLAQQERIAMLDKALEQSKKFDAVPEPEPEPEPVTDTDIELEPRSEPVPQPKTQTDELEKPETEISEADDSLSEPLMAEDKGVNDVLPPVEEALPANGGASAIAASSEPVSSVKTISTSAGGSDEPKDSVKRVAITKSPKTHPFFRDSVWVASQDDSAYTLQVLGSYSESTAIRFVERLDLQDLYFVESSYQGKRWFVVLYGVFPSINAARDAIVLLPQSVAREKPWVRSFSGLK